MTFEVSLDTCDCVLDLINFTQVRGCSIHSSYDDAMKHNRMLNWNFNDADRPDAQKAMIQSGKRTWFGIVVTDQTIIDRYNSRIV